MMMERVLAMTLADVAEGSKSMGEDVSGMVRTLLQLDAESLDLAERIRHVVAKGSDQRFQVA